VRRAALEHPEERLDDADHGAPLLTARVGERRSSMEVPEQLVRAVDEVDAASRRLYWILAVLM
jgi:hypothetical protein